MSGPFAPRRDGSYDVTLSEIEVSAIGRLAEDVGTLIDASDRSTVRLFPPGYADDEDRQASFAEMTRDDLLAAKRRAAEAVRASIEAGSTKKGTWRGRLDLETAEAWLAIINDARLVLGTRLDVTEEMDHAPLPDRDPRAPAHNMYLYLSALEEYLIEALAGSVTPD